MLSGLEDGAAVVVNPTDDLTEGLQVQARPATGSDNTSSPGGEKKSAPSPTPTATKLKPQDRCELNREDPHIHAAF